MSAASSSTSSSEQAPSPSSRGWRDAAATFAWALVMLAAMDVAAGLAFPLPASPNIPPSSMQGYFQYGRSIESKLDRLVGRNDDEAALVAFAGWPEPPQGANQPTDRSDARHLVSFYGMSFSNRIAETLEKEHPGFAVRKLGGPGAPPGQVFKLFESDRGRHDADFVVFTVLDSAVGGLLATNSFCRNFDGPQVCMFPRYFMPGDVLEKREPPAESLEEFRSIWLDTGRRARLVDQLRRWDAFFDPFSFHENLLDRSTIGRIVRRSLSRRKSEAVEELYLANGEFIEDSGPIRVLRALVDRFIIMAKEDDTRPLVLMIQDRGSGSRLQTVLGPVIEKHGALSLNTESICSSKDRHNLLPDSHFTPEADRRFADALARIVSETSAP